MWKLVAGRGGLTYSWVSERLEFCRDPESGIPEKLFHFSSMRLFVSTRPPKDPPRGPVAVIQHHERGGGSRTVPRTTNESGAASRPWPEQNTRSVETPRVLHHRLVHPIRLHGCTAALSAHKPHADLVGGTFMLLFTAATTPIVNKQMGGLSVLAVAPSFRFRYYRTSAGFGSGFICFESHLCPGHAGGVTVPVGSDAQVFILELIISFILMFVVTAVSTDKFAFYIGVLLEVFKSSR
ncbi:hypothetical protein SELMODRAFT_410562 [Selaginella moellendorffii]|uniref:Uncharacterized protein n=1 Tax=Selaginella moellendorffii TaxID=88036 RepID=D8RF53_SELML|nr:hypothetical protein SELMODRAFT_410562 [Selaginella moellendorffii]